MTKYSTMEDAWSALCDARAARDAAFQTIDETQCTLDQVAAELAIAIYAKDKAFRDIEMALQDLTEWDPLFKAEHI